MQPPAAFIEAQYYQGGLRTIALTPGGTRPKWAPDGDRVGFRDEAKIGKGDFVVEYARIDVDGEPVSWLAVHSPSTDATFGDRQNHASVGLWLHGAVLVDFEMVLDGLKKMTLHLAETKEPEALLGPATEFVKDYVEPNARVHSAYPTRFRGVPASSSPLLPSKVWRLSADPDDEKAMDRVSGLLALLTFCDPKAYAQSRFLIWVTASAKGDNGVEELDGRTGTLAQVVELLGAIPEAVGEQSSELEDVKGALLSDRQALTALQSKNAELLADIEDKDRSIAELSKDLQATNELEVPLELIRQIKGNTERFNQILSLLTESSTRFREVESAVRLQGSRIEAAAGRRKREVVSDNHVRTGGANGADTGSDFEFFPRSWAVLSICALTFLIAFGALYYFVGTR